MRGNRMASPDLCRLDRCRPSNATSSTSPLSSSCTTSRTGPNRLIVLRRTNRSIRVSPGTVTGRIGARGGEFGEGRERHQRRQVDAWLIETRDRGFEARPPLDEGPWPQIVFAFDQQVVGAKMCRELLDQLAAHDL